MDMQLDPGLVRRMQETLRLQVHRHGGVHLAAMLNTPEVPRTVREDVLMHLYGPQLRVPLPPPPSWPLPHRLASACPPMVCHACMACALHRVRRSESATFRAGSCKC